MLSERVDPLVGEMLGKDYRVIEPIGFGGMAVVYLVEHQTLLKRFAAKVLSIELAKNGEARARFTQEAHAASQLDHENIVNISDFGVTADRRPFFVMELLRGQTLDQRLAGGPMSLEEVVAVSVPVARALAFAHAEGIVHRDIKPENVFLVQRSQGRWGVKVVDFGIAKTPQSDRLTKMGQTLGSPHFMSPEACRGDDVDARADIYSFGVLLYLLTCGRLPFDDPSLLKVLQLHVTQPVPPPREINPQLSPGLAAVIERALAKEPDDRYPSMSALLVDFEAAIPAGADRLLIEQQSGGAAAFRATPFPKERTTGPLAYTPSGSNPPYAASPSTPPPAPPKRTRAVLFAGLALALAGAGAAAFVVLGNKPAGERVPIVEHAPPAPAPTPAPATAPTIQAPVEPAPAPPPAPVKRQYRIASSPSGATVTLDGARLGDTPLTLEVDARAGTGELVVAKAGYASVEQVVHLDEDVTLDLTLSRKVTAATTKKRRPEPPPAKAGSADKPPPKNGDPTLDIRLSR